MKSRKTIDGIAWGAEPNIAHGEIFNNSDLIKIYNWYSYNKTTKDALKYLFNFLNPNKSKFIKKLPDWKISVTLGWISRIKFKGGVVPDKTDIWFESNINKLILDSKTIIYNSKSLEKNKKKRSDRSGEIIGILEEKLDEYVTSGKLANLNQIMINNDIGPIISTKIKDFYSPQLSEPYISIRTKKFIENVISICHSKKRKISIKSNKELTKCVKYAKIYSDIKSISPEKIIGGKELFLYNFKNKRLYHIISGDDGFIIDKSMVRNLKTCVYKVVSQDSILNKFSKLTKLKMRKLFTEIKRKSVNNLTISKSTRLNESVVIIKVY